MIYCMSDFHGQYELYLKMLEKINLNNNDTLFVLGDVIDRGSDGIRILQDIMHRSNIVFIIGNHEYMMYKVVTKSKIVISEIDEIKPDMDYYLWEMNGGAKTHNDFYQLSIEEQNSIIKYLEQAYVVVPQLEVGGRCFMLAHSTHPVNYYDRPVIMNDVPTKELERIIWKREYLSDSSSEEYADELSLDERYDSDTTLVIGHTPTPHIDKMGFSERGYGIMVHSDNGHIIDIDCGCAISNSSMRCLGCLCLDTLEEFYVRES